mmetsp:Transcript_2478/g.8809  ORF Transcript_2478/g.8809 Transcript_2478/m.8809 type:complete len:298 (+) Transcript_2478:1260-2153(+)
MDRQRLHRPAQGGAAPAAAAPPLPPAAAADRARASLRGRLWRRVHLRDGALRAGDVVRHPGPPQLQGLLGAPLALPAERVAARLGQGAEARLAPPAPRRGGAPRAHLLAVDADARRPRGAAAQPRHRLPPDGRRRLAAGAADHRGRLHRRRVDQLPAPLDARVRPRHQPHVGGHGDPARRGLQPGRRPAGDGPRAPDRADQAGHCLPAHHARHGRGAHRSPRARQALPDAADDGGRRRDGRRRACRRGGRDARRASFVKGVARRGDPHAAVRRRGRARGAAGGRDGRHSAARARDAR